MVTVECEHECLVVVIADDRICWHNEVRETGDSILQTSTNDILCRALYHHIKSNGAA